MGRTKPIVSADYIVGLTDGEGCFYVNIWKSSSYKAGYGVQMHFHIKLQEKDKEILQRVCNTLSCGNVYYQNDNRKNHTSCYRYTVSSKKDIFEKIIPFFEENSLQTYSKNRSFKIFCKIAKLILQDKHLTKEGVEKIRALKVSMNQKTIGFA